MQYQYDPQSRVPAQPNIDSLLLKLPGELRNRIYGFAVEHKCHRFQLYHKDRRPLLQCGSCSTKRASASRRSFFGLTQVCRILRKEYLPLYLAQTRIHISWTELPWYLATFVLSSSAPELAVGNIILSFGDCKVLAPEHETRQVNFLPLINLNRLAPKFTVRHEHLLCGSYILQHRPRYLQLTDALISEVRLFRMLLDPNGHSKFHEFIRNDVTHVTFHTTARAKPVILFGLTEGHSHPWMQIVRTADYSSFVLKSYNKWQADLDLDLGLDAQCINFEVDTKAVQRRRLLQQLRYLTGSTIWVDDDDGESEGESLGGSGFYSAVRHSEDNYIRRLRNRISKVLGEKR